MEPPDYLIHILQHAGTDWQFERICCKHYTDIEGITYFPTSKSYDLGGDGRAVN